MEEVQACEAAYYAITKILKPYRSRENEMGWRAYLKTDEYKESAALEEAARVAWKLYKKALKEVMGVDLEKAAEETNGAQEGSLYLS